MLICCLWCCSKACILSARNDDWIGTEIENVKNKTPFNSIDSKTSTLAHGIIVDATVFWRPFSTRYSRYLHAHSNKAHLLLLNFPNTNGKRSPIFWNTANIKYIDGNKYLARATYTHRHTHKIRTHTSACAGAHAIEHSNRSIDIARVLSNTHVHILSNDALAVVFIFAYDDYLLWNNGLIPFRNNGESFILSKWCCTNRYHR